MSILSTILIAALLPSASVREIPSAVRTEPETTCAAANARLSARPDERIFFRLRGRVVAELGPRFVLEDVSGTALIIVSCDTPYRRGDVLSLVCTAFRPSPDSFLIAEALDLAVIAHDPPPPVAAVSPADLISGRHAFREVALTGVVTDAFPDEVDIDWCIVIVESEGSKAMVWVPGQTITEDRLAALVDASVRITGVVFPSINSSRRYLRQWMQTASADAIRILEPAPADPFARNAGGDHRRTCSGTVLSAWNGRSLFIRTTDGERLEVRLCPGQPVPAAGTRVTVSAFVRSNAFYRHLSNALIRIEDGPPSAPETPVDIRAAEVLGDGKGHRKINSRMNGRTVRLRGKVRKVLLDGTPAAQLHLESDGETVPVWIGTDAAAPAIGAGVEVTGTCLITTETDSDNHLYDKLSGFAVALRDPSELKVIEPPQWWTPVRFVILIAILLAVLVAILVWNASLRIVAERRGREMLRAVLGKAEADLRIEERTRLAVELHDTIAQSLAGVTFEINAADRLSGRDPGKSHTHLTMADRTLKSCRDELRNCIWDLRGLALEQRDMNEAIRQAVKPHVAGARLAVRFNVPRTRLSDNTVHALIRIIRELSINAVRHGHASAIRIAGSLDGDRLAFSVRDDGRGFDPATAPGVPEGHFGLQGIRERIARLGGTLDIESEPGHGTKTSISINAPGGSRKEDRNNG